MSAPILVIGSANTDMVVKTAKLPAPGETRLGGEFLMNPGGKGANQAVAATRLGGVVTFVAKVGDDIFGREAIAGFEREGINAQYILTDPDNPSGVALINVDEHGENCIAVAPGANGNLTAADVETALQIALPNTLVLLQLEIPLPTVEYVIKLAAERGLRVVLNPAPARTLPASLLSNLFLITPNETEAEILTGMRVTDEVTAQQAGVKFREMGVANTIITLGAKGAYLYADGTGSLITMPAVVPVDTTAAGDCFNGALTVALSEEQSLPDAVAFACRAAAISVTRMGAQASLPTRAELTE